MHYDAKLNSDGSMDVVETGDMDIEETNTTILQQKNIAFLIRCKMPSRNIRIVANCIGSLLGSIMQSQPKK